MILLSTYAHRNLDSTLVDPPTRQPCTKRLCELEHTAYFLQVKNLPGTCSFLKLSPISGTLIKKSERRISESLPVTFSSSNHAYDLNFSAEPDTNILCTNKDGNVYISEEGIKILKMNSDESTEKTHLLQSIEESSDTIANFYSSPALKVATRDLDPHSGQPVKTNPFLALNSPSVCSRTQSLKPPPTNQYKAPTPKPPKSTRLPSS